MTEGVKPFSHFFCALRIPYIYRIKMYPVPANENCYPKARVL